VGAVLSLMPSVLLGQTGESAGWAFLALPYVFALGFALSGVGLLLGIIARLVFTGKPSETTENRS
jgi:hypothetical protein